jgi:hypothetical protein
LSCGRRGFSKVKSSRSHKIGVIHFNNPLVNIFLGTCTPAA